MACSLKTHFSVSMYKEAFHECRAKGSVYFYPSNGALQLSDHKGLSHWNVKASPHFSVNAHASSICVGKAMRWWEKTIMPNMVEIHSAQELVDSLLNAGDRLVIVDFYSPGCGGCKALHPKICQLADLNQNAIFLKVNYEELKTMCHSLHIHVLPFFRIYRGAEGRLCSFSCTNKTIHKFKDALAKYGTERSSLGPAKGLDDSELLALSSTGQISLRNLALQQSNKGDNNVEAFILSGIDRMGTEKGTALAMV